MELSTSQSTAQKYKNEIDVLKKTSDEQVDKLKKDLESSKAELSNIQKTNNQLKVLARKYKSKCDELEKQISSPSDESNKLKELESQAQSCQEEKGKLTEEVSKLKEEIEALRSQMNETDQKAKRIAQEARIKLSKKFDEVKIYQAQLRLLREQMSKKTTTVTQALSSSSTMPQTSKMSVSSTYVSASLQQPSTSSFEPSLSFNIQPSSSNEDNDRLQSAQITSHTTSLDDNSLESFSNSLNQVSDSIVSSNKRGFPHYDSEHELKRRKDNDVSLSEEDSIDQSMVEDDSNDVSEIRDVQSNYEERNATDDVQESNDQMIEADADYENHNVESNEESPLVQAEQTESSDGNASSCN